MPVLRTQTIKFTRDSRARMSGTAYLKTKVTCHRLASRHWSPMEVDEPDVMTDGNGCGHAPMEVDFPIFSPVVFSVAPASSCTSDSPSRLPLSTRSPSLGFSPRTPETPTPAGRIMPASVKAPSLGFSPRTPESPSPMPATGRSRR